MKDLKAIINKANQLVNGEVQNSKTVEETAEVVKEIAKLAPLNVSEFEDKITALINTAERIETNFTPMTLEELESVEMLIHEVKYAKYQVGFLNAQVRKLRRELKKERRYERE